MLIKLGCGGVDLGTLDINMQPVLAAAERCFSSEPVITSTWDGTHGAGSLHYFKRAIDFRKPQNAEDAVMNMKRQLGTKYDIVLEDTHIHAEYDPD